MGIFEMSPKGSFIDRSHHGRHRSLTSTDDSGDADDSEDAESGAQSTLGVGLALLSASADHFMASAEVATEREGLRRLPVSRGLEDLGVPLEQRFRHFVMRAALREAILEMEDQALEEDQALKEDQVLEESLSPADETHVVKDVEEHVSQHARKATALLEVQGNRSEWFSWPWSSPSPPPPPPTTTLPPDEVVTGSYWQRGKKGSRCCLCGDGNTWWSARGYCDRCNRSLSAVADAPMGCDRDKLPFSGGKACYKKCLTALEGPGRRNISSVKRNPKSKWALIKKKFIRTCSSGWIDRELYNAGVPINDKEKADYQDAKRALRNYCVLRASVQEGSTGAIRVEGVEKIRGDFEPGGDVQGLAESARQNGDLRMTSEDKRKLKRLNALKKSNWLKDVDSLQNKQLHEIKEAYLKILHINVDLTAITRLIEKGEEIDWMNVRKEPKNVLRKIARWITRQGKRAIKFTLQYIEKAARNVGKFFKNIWRSFSNAIHRGERKCLKDTDAMAESSAHKAGLGRVPKDDSAAAAMGDRMEHLDENDLEEEAGKADDALKKVEKTAGAGLDEGKMRKNAEEVRNNMEEVENRVAGNGPGVTDANAKETLEKMDDSEEKIEEAQALVCKNNTKNAATSMRDSFSSSRAKMKAGALWALPLLGIRGVSVTAGVVQGGLEEVIDFKNREVGIFRFGAGFFGTSSLTAGIGGYTGFGWKGYKENWTLEEGYQTGIWISKGLDVFGVGGAVTVGTDADDSGPGPWVPEPHGINALLFGWSLATPSLIPLPVNFVFDYGVSRYTMIGTECYNSLGELIKRIWWPHCNNCYPGLERFKITGLGFGIHVASFPIITESMFSILAALHERHRSRWGSYQPVCSDQSTNNRDNVTFLATRAAQLLYENTEMIMELDELVYNLSTIMAYNDEVAESAELREWEAEVNTKLTTCPRFPSDTNSSGLLLTIQILQDIPKTELYEDCDALGLSSACKDKDNRKQMVERLALARELQNSTISKDELQNVIDSVEKSMPYSDYMFNKRVHLHTLKEWHRSCEDAHRCKSGWDVSSLIQRYTSKRLLAMCRELGVECEKTCGFFKRIQFNCDWYDTEIMAMRIVHALGGGFLGKASEDEPFGVCRKDSDCWQTTNLACLSDEKGKKRCQCKEDYCYSSNSDNQGVCKHKTKDVERIIDSLRRGYGSLKLQIGKLAGIMMKQVPVPVRGMADVVQDVQDSNQLQRERTASVLEEEDEEEVFADEGQDAEADADVEDDS